MNDDNHLLPDDEAELHAYVDGRLDPGRRAAVQARLAGDEEAAARVQRLERAAGRAAHAASGNAAGTGAGRTCCGRAMQLDRRSSRIAPWQRWGGMAAAVLLAFGLGWGGHARWESVTGVGRRPQQRPGGLRAPGGRRVRGLPARGAAPGRSGGRRSSSTWCSGCPSA